MGNNDLKNELKDLLLEHLTEREMIAYCEQALDYLTQARADEHLKRCFLCRGELAPLLAMRAAPSDQENTAEDIARVRQARQKRAGQLPSAPKSLDVTPKVPLSERLGAYLQQLVASWQITFAQAGAHRGSEPGEEVWRWESGDSRLQASAVQERNGDLTVHFRSSDPEMEGVRLKVSLGPFKQEITMHGEAEAEIGARLTVPRRERPKKLEDMTIEKL